MKVRVSFTVDVDPDAWNENYYTGTEQAAIRADVRAYIEQGVLAQFADLGVLTEEK